MGAGASSADWSGDSIKSAADVVSFVGVVHGHLQSNFNAKACTADDLMELSSKLRDLAEAAQRVAAAMGGTQPVVATAVASGVVAVGSRIAKSNYDEHMKGWSKAKPLYDSTTSGFAVVAR